MPDCIESKTEFGRCPSAVSELFLLGTVHCDPKGFSRTRLFLERYRPGLILVEISEFALKFRKQHSCSLRKTFVDRVRAVSKKLKIEFGKAMKHPQISSILRQIIIPFEYRASAAYAGKTGTELVIVDHSEFSREWIEKTWPEMMSISNIEKLLQLESAEQSIPSLYRRAWKRIREGPSLPEKTPADMLRRQERENLISQKIISALEPFSMEKAVYIGGWWHLSSGGSVKTIRELLGIGLDSCGLLDREIDA